MCSQGQILLETPDAIAMMTQTWVGKKCDVFTRDLSLFAGHNVRLPATKLEASM